MTGMLPYLACGLIACAIMLELRAIRRLTAEIKRLGTVFVALVPRSAEDSEAGDA